MDTPNEPSEPQTTPAADARGKTSPPPPTTDTNHHCNLDCKCLEEAKAMIAESLAPLKAQIDTMESRIFDLEAEDLLTGYRSARQSPLPVSSGPGNRSLISIMLGNTAPTPTTSPTSPSSTPPPPPPYTKHESQGGIDASHTDWDPQQESSGIDHRAGESSTQIPWRRHGVPANPMPATHVQRGFRLAVIDGIGHGSGNTSHDRGGMDQGRGGLGHGCGGIGHNRGGMGHGRGGTDQERGNTDQRRGGMGHGHGGMNQGRDNMGAGRGGMGHGCGGRDPGSE